VRPAGGSAVNVLQHKAVVLNVANHASVVIGRPGTLLIVGYQVQKQACFVHLRIDLVTGGVALPLEQVVSCDFRMTAGGARHR